MITCNDSRKYFPYIETGLKYFNHAAIGPISSLVKEKIDRYIYDRSEGCIENYFETVPQINSAKEKIAGLLNTKSENIAWNDNVSNAINLIANGLNWEIGDQIILNDLEFPSNVYPFLNLKEQGVEVIFAKSENGTVDLPQIEELVTKKTKLISISMVQFLTGYRANLKLIGEFCKKNNIIFCVDGIQGAGVVQINVNECNIDFFAGGSQKWLMGLQGLSYFYCSPSLQAIIKQKYVGWTSVKNAWNLIDYDLNLINSADRFQNGTNSRIGIIALNASLDLFEEVGYKNIENQILVNTAYLFNHFSEMGFNLVLKNIQKDYLAGIITIKHNHSESFYNKLKEKQIICSLREGMIRFSPHFYNNKEDLDFLIEHMKELQN